MAVVTVVNGASAQHEVQMAAAAAAAAAQACQNSTNGAVLESWSLAIVLLMLTAHSS